MTSGSKGKLARVEGQSSHILKTNLARVAIVVVVLLMWEYFPYVEWLRKNTFFDPFYISSPSRVALRLWDMTFGSLNGMLWKHLVVTLEETFVGLIVGVVSGFLIGVWLSQNRVLANVFEPFILAVNSLPRLVMIPLVTIVFGFGFSSKVVMVWLMVFFLVFFNTFQGGRSIERHYVDSCRILGASDLQLMKTLIIPNALAWAFASLPNAVSFALISAVLAEYIGGNVGIGYMIIIALSSLDSTNLMVTMVVLGICGVALSQAARVIERRLLSWRPEHRTMA
ncbi:MAG: ABC transporter permease [Chloroflexi bacterium]|nr:ABC transporter permease [Chloroflexota bacterium]